MNKNLKVSLSNGLDRYPERKILYIDMDGVIADFNKKFLDYFPTEKLDENSNVDDLVLNYSRNIFAELDIYGNHDTVKAIFNLFTEHYDVYILSTPMWKLPESYMDKRIWLEKHFGDKIYKRLILTHNKSLLRGHYLIDDRVKNGAGDFKGEHIYFGKSPFHDMVDVALYLANKDGWKTELIELIGVS